MKRLTYRAWLVLTWPLASTLVYLVYFPGRNVVEYLKADFEILCLLWDDGPLL
jgi:hypothetical protein